MSDQASGSQTRLGPSGDDAKKRKRNTISCFQCRIRKRRCTADYIEKCENCVREGLECRRPDIDGRKTRWKRGGQAGLNRNADSSNSGGDGLERGHCQVSEEGQYTGGLFDQHRAPDPSGLYESMPISDPAAFPFTSQTAQNHLPQQHLPGAWIGSTDASLRKEDPKAPYDNWAQLFETSSPDLVNSSNRSFPFRSSPSPGTSAQSATVKKVVWWRFHGPSAIAPGLKRITLKVRLDDKTESPAPPTKSGHTNSLHTSQDHLVDEGGMPRPDLMLHLLDVFMTHFGCQYPALSKSQLERDLVSRSGSTLLFNCIASTASRFSKHPEIALPHLEPHSYGLIFLKTAKNMLGNVLAVPCRETVIALTLLAGISHGIDSESEEWMAAGMAVRMAIDLGLHLAPPLNSVMSQDDRRLDRLTFWSVYFLDVSLSFGVGRETAFRLAAITQMPPTEDDFESHVSGGDSILGSSANRSMRKVFTYAAKLAFAYGPVVNVVNGPWDNQSEWETQAQQITQQAVEVYNALPVDMHWSAVNLQTHSRADQGSIFVQMHLWMHTILASGYLIGTDVLRPDRKAYLHGGMTPSNTTASRLWQNSARTIGDILILSDIVNPFVYHALPFSNQPFVVAGCCYIKDADAQLQRSKVIEHIESGSLPGQDTNSEGRSACQPRAPSGMSSNNQDDAFVRGEKAEMFRTLLQSVTSNNIAALRQGLVRQTRYWAGVAWVAEVLAQRMSGISMDDIDLRIVTEGLESTVATTDARMFTQSTDEGLSGYPHPNSASALAGDDPSSAWFDMPLSLEADWLADTTFLQSQGYPVVVEDFTSDWATNLM